jgi:uncharacterized protein (UPF0332 family)
MIGAPDSRLRFARDLRELADRSSEIELRNALSRSYYSIYHAAKVLWPKVDHHNIAEEMGKLDRQTGLEIEVLQKLRSQADYDPQFVEREFEGSLELFRIQVQERVEQGRRIFRRLTDEIGRQSVVG